jgi:N-methylhydantoinase A/oxoprolinase/acetone carboxylase beta subunit
MRDLLQIGDQSRPEIFRLNIVKVSSIVDACGSSPARFSHRSKTPSEHCWAELSTKQRDSQPDLLHEEVIELSERIRVITDTSDKVVDERHEVRIGITGERIEILQPLDIASVTQKLQRAYDKGLQLNYVSLNL